MAKENDNNIKPIKFGYLLNDYPPCYSLGWTFVACNMKQDYVTSLLYKTNIVTSSPVILTACFIHTISHYILFKSLMQLFKIALFATAIHSTPVPNRNCPQACNKSQSYTQLQQNLHAWYTAPLLSCPLQKSNTNRAFCGSLLSFVQNCDGKERCLGEVEMKMAFWQKHISAGFKEEGELSLLKCEQVKSTVPAECPPL